MSKKVAVVTGGNKGIGLAVSRGLAEKGFHVVLTSRNVQNGEKACRTLTSEGLDVVFHKLDVTQPAEIKELRHFLEKGYGRVDVLINNAGIFKDAKETPVLHTKIETIEETLKTNTFAPLLLCQELVPLMKKHGSGRIVNVSSGLGQLSDMQGHYAAYRMSKAALNAVTRILACELAGTNIAVNSICPGWVKTDMGGPDAERTPEEGADTAVWLATLPDRGPTGKFFRDRSEIPW
ncbi:MAG: short-chain dehydrogenase [Omnitrophica bacterium GWA2_52_8]|nr:MAG: short-chain dehydrogenase [Omnitrophica bacterium GWA2_52_8]